ncbi:NUDIX domain-containing protein [Solwaraspora sp. WMMD1047]|uniref:NUDIX hydrolase n=1 Tax=Solwaraspora sp. WMMD1047 TaxID=3016102 RepID=UPI002417D543|nr:NUDIX domain-containing protein [Solwaraspora sp. WMMD1047]MDG4832922.1 NUDIX domain-containing protein [Solwaraspora sp. WMMD1047]
MRSSVAAVHELVTGLLPGDQLEAEHRSAARRWLESTDDVYRRAKPAEPPQHLVSYVVPVDPTDGALLLVDHLKAGLWLPPGGHVDPDEHPAATARRELHEELGVAVGPATTFRPAFLTVTPTVRAMAGHTDVSLWFPVIVDPDVPLVPNHGEFREARWWSLEQLRSADPTRFDPHLRRFLDKVAMRVIRGQVVSLRMISSARSEMSR